LSLGSSIRSVRIYIGAVVVVMIVERGDVAFALLIRVVVVAVVGWGVGAVVGAVGGNAGIVRLVAILDISVILSLWTPYVVERIVFDWHDSSSLHIGNHLLHYYLVEVGVEFQ